MAEQLGFHERSRQRRTVDLDERLRGPRARGVDGVGQETFAGAGLAGEQHGRRLVQRRDLAGTLEHRLHRARLPHQSLEADVGRGATAVVGQLLLQETRLAGAVGEQLQLFQIHGLLDVVERAELHRFHGTCDRAVGGQHDHRDHRVERADPLEQIEPAHAGQPHVGEDDIRLQGGEQLQRLLPGARHLRLVAVVRQERLGGARQRLLVVHDQHGRAAHATLRAGRGGGATSPLALGSQIRTVVPRPTVLAMSSRPPASST